MTKSATPIDLTSVFENATSLHALLELYHPQNSDRLNSAIEAARKAKDENRLTQLQRLYDFLSTYHFDENGKPSKYFPNLRNLLIETAQKFEARKHSAKDSEVEPEQEEENFRNKKISFREFFMACIKPDLTVSSKNRIKQNELSYEPVFERVSKRYDSKGIKLPDEAKERHDFTYGDRRSLKGSKELNYRDGWLTSPESRDWKKALPEKIEYYRQRSQIFALQDIMQAMSSEMFMPGFVLSALKTEIVLNDFEKAVAKKMKWQDDLVIGIADVFFDPKINPKFLPETYKKIRKFLAYECDDIRSLNRGAALLTLIFPDYKKFTDYVSKWAKYNAEANSIDLAKLYDTSDFDFQDNDYIAWGELLRDHGPKNFFYLKTAHLLDNIPRNSQGKILISQLDRQLYDKVAELLAFCTPEDLERYSELKIVKDIASVRHFKDECSADVEGKADKVSGIPEVNLPGERFGKPGYSFSRLPYNDDRFFIVGRFTKSCEYIDGEWGATVKEGYRNRDSTYYCLFDPKGKIIAHSWVYTDPQTWNVVLDGFEADQNNENVSKALLEKIVAELNKDYPRSFVVGTSAQHLGLEQVRTIRRGEEADDHMKVIHKGDILSIKQMVEEAGIAPITPAVNIDEKISQAELLRFLASQTARKPKDP